MKIYFYILLLLVVFTLNGCSDESKLKSEISGLKNDLEEKEKILLKMEEGVSDKSDVSG